MTFGVISILLITIVIILNGFALDRQIGRDYDWIGKIIISYVGLFPSAISSLIKTMPFKINTFFVVYSY